MKIRAAKRQGCKVCSLKTEQETPCEVHIGNDVTFTLRPGRDGLRAGSEPDGQQTLQNKLEPTINSNKVGLRPEDTFGEFDPGSGRTLAACLTHASRTELSFKLAFEIA
jgi:hypothetical protein